MVAPAIGIAVVLVVAALWFFFFRGGTAAAPPTPASGPTTDIPVQVLPSTGTHPGCAVGTPGEWPDPSLTLDNATLQAVTYNVPSGTTGHDGLCYGSNGALLSYSNWSAVGGSGYSWFSYPQVTYGVLLWDGADSTYTPQSSHFSLPATVSSVVPSDLWITTNYAVHGPSPADTSGFDYSLDDFFTEEESPHMQIGPSDPFVEVMVWFDHRISGTRHYLNWSAPTLVNGTLEATPWSVGYYCHGTDNSTNSNMSFDFSFDGQDTGGLSEGTVGVNMSAVLQEVEVLMPAVTCWTGPTGDFSNFYWEDNNMGSEDGALGGSSFNYNWTVYDYCLHVDVGTPSAGGLACAASPSSVPAPQARTLTPDSLWWQGSWCSARLAHFQALLARARLG